MRSLSIFSSLRAEGQRQTRSHGYACEDTEPVFYQGYEGVEHVGLMNGSVKKYSVKGYKVRRNPTE